MAKLGVNIDHVATVRQARMTNEPDPVWASVEAQLGGADGITFHLREDRRHINDRDARLLKETVICKLNMEMTLLRILLNLLWKSLSAFQKLKWQQISKEVFKCLLLAGKLLGATP